jgi:anthranilate synthase component 1
VLISLQASTAEDAQRQRLCWAVHPADLFTPVRAFRSLRAAGHHVCLLESVEGPARLARWSFVGVDPGAHFRGGPRGCTLTTQAGTENLAGPSHEALREAARRYATPPVGQPGLPPFTGGWIGCFTYEWAASLEPSVPVPEDDPHRLGEAIFDHYSDLVAFDHASQRLILLAGCPQGSADYGAACQRLEQLASDLSADDGGRQGFRLLEPEPRPQTTRSAYEAGVERLQHEIGQGEIFQAVLSQRFEQRYEGDPFVLYRVLRLVNSAPHMFFFQADGLTLVGSSPERLASLTGRLAQVVPIAGTRPRDPDPDRDEALAAELLADPKERAEHDMLVDLARNDLGRVARVGTVAVKEYGVLEKFPTVQHLVSRVEAELASGRDALDLLAATFPAGTVSGAPKVRAMQLLAELEGVRRGPYAGAFGYLDGAGNLDMAIAIRTLFLQGDTIHVQAGAGVVFDSVPEREYEETLHKSKALFQAIQMAASPAFQPEPDPSTQDPSRRDPSRPGVRP